MKRTKTQKINFDIILRNTKTKDEILIKKVSIPVRVSVDKKILHNIMKKNLRLIKDDEDEREGSN